MAEASFLAQLESATFSQIIATAEGIGANRGAPAVIELYRNWIATQAGGERNLYAAWFNLGVEYAHGGQVREAILAYRTALALKPDFSPPPSISACCWNRLVSRTRRCGPGSGPCRRTRRARRCSISARG